MAVNKKENPEKLMLFLFPLITLSLFVVAVVLFHYIPILLAGFHS